VEQQQTDTSAGLHGDVKSIESGLKALWERARRTAEVIRELRENKRGLEAKIGELELEVRRLQQELLGKEQALKAAASQGDGGAGKNAFLSNGEKEALSAKIKVLLSKIEAYL
jgi:chromosome segregation ATPase